MNATSTESDLESQVDAYLRPFLDTNNFNGSILIAKQDQVLLAKGFGFSDRKQQISNKPETVYHLCSVSRIFTSAAILLLEQQGKLSINDKVSRHIPDWPRGDEITVHHLLTLSAGFPNINTLPGYGSWSLAQQTPQTLCDKFRDLPLEFEPGTKSVHSNSNYNLLALLIERVSGKKFGEFLRDELFAPLEMTQTAHDDHSEKVPHEAIGYRPAGQTGISPMWTPDWTVKTGNGSLYSTVKDLYKFDRMLVHHRLLNRKSTTQLFTEHFPQNGYGWFVGKQSGKITSVNISGRSPGFGAFWIREIESDVTVIVLGNLYSSATISIGRDLLRIAKGEQVPAPELSAESLPPALLDELQGAYQFGPDFYRPNGVVRFDVRDGHLYDGRGAWLIPAGEATFIHRTYWSKLQFIRDQSGKITSLKYDEFTGQRLEE